MYVQARGMVPYCSPTSFAQVNLFNGDAVRYTEEISDWMWRSVVKQTASPSQDHRKSLLIFWYMANIKKCVHFLRLSAPTSDGH